MFAARCLMVLFLAVLVAAAQAGPASRKEAGDKVVLENDHLVATVSPAQGGALVSLKAKPEPAELLAGPGFVESNLYPRERTQGLAALAFHPAATGAAQAAEVVCEMTAMLPPQETLTEEQLKDMLGGGAWSAAAWGQDADALATRPFEKVRLTKRFRLRSTEAAVRAEYELTNTGKTPVAVCLATRWAFRPRGRMCVSSREGALSFLLPLDKALLDKDTVLNGRGAAWLYDQPAAWGGVLAAPVGLVAWSDPRHVSFVRVDVAKGETEVGRTRVTLTPGATFKTSASLLLARGMDRVVGADDDFAADVQVQPAEADSAARTTRVEAAATERKPAAAAKAADDADDKDVEGGKASGYAGPALKLEARVCSASDRRAGVTIEARRLGETAGRKLVSKTLDLKAGVAAAVPVSFRPPSAGSYVVRVEVREGGRAAAVFEHPVVAGEPSGWFVPAAIERQGEVNEDFRYRHAPRAPYPCLADWQPTTQVETPHVKYGGHPLAGGPVKALFIIPYWNARDVVESQQRLSLEPDTLVIGKAGYRKKFMQHYGQTLQHAPPDETDRLRALLAKPHDVIVLVNLFGDWFSADLMAEIQRQVERGTGLVALMPDAVVGPLETMSKAAAKATDHFAPTRARLGAVGRGRVAFFDGVSNYAYVGMLRTEEEHEDFTRAVLWAARGAPAAAVESDGKTASLDRDAGSAQVMLRGLAKTGFRGGLRVVVRRDLLKDYRFYGTVDMQYRMTPTYEDAAGPIEQQVAVPAGGRQAVPVKLPPLAAGSYSLDAYLLDEAGAVVSWRRLPLRLTADCQVDKMTVSRPGAPAAEFTFSGKDPVFCARPMDTIQMACAVKRGSADRIELEGADPWGRVVFRQAAPLAGGEASFAPSLHACLHRILILKATLLRGEERLAEQRAQVFVYARPEREPRFELRAYEEVRANGEEAGWHVRVGGGSPLELAWFNIQQTEYGGWIPGCKILMPGEAKDQPPAGADKAAAKDLAGGKPAAGDDLGAEAAGRRPAAATDGYIRVPCLNDPAWRDKALAEVEKRYRDRSVYGPYRGFAVDEWFYYKEVDPSKPSDSNWRREFIVGKDTNICRCPHCLTRFLAFVKQRFQGDLAALNRAWGTRFGRWEEVDPPILDPKTKTAPAEALWPRILAHRLFIDTQLPDVLAETQRRITAIDPGCQTGMSGCWGTGLWNGMDFYQLARSCRYNILYRDADMWSDFGGGTAANWIGYGAKYNPAKETASVWRTLLDGKNAVGYYAKHIWSTYRADYTFHPGPAAFFETVRTIQDTGVAKLLLGRRQTDPVALYYDPLNIYVAGLEEWTEDAETFIKEWKNAGRSHDEFPYQVCGTYRGLLNARFIQPFWTAYEHLEQGNFNRPGAPRLFLLPYGQCLSDRQAATLERFVQEGGVLVADVQPGLRDRHGLRREQGALDRVFGVRREGPWKMRARKDAAGQRVAVRFGRDFGEPFALSFDAIEAGVVVPVSAKPLAEYTLDGRKAPAFLVNAHGKGKAVLLNFVPAGFRAVTLGGVEGETVEEKDVEGKSREMFDRLFQKALDLAGLTPPVRCEPAATVYRFGEGAISYIGLGVSYRTPAHWDPEYVLTLPGPAHVYDMREGKYVGQVDKVRARFDPAQRRTEQIFAVMPYRVEGLDVDLPGRSVRAGEPFEFTARVRPAEAQKQRHVIGLRATDPQGRSPRWHRAAFETENGVARCRFDPACNEARGPWKLALTDAATGAQTQVDLTVE